MTQSSVEIELSEEDALIQATFRDILTREGAQERARRWWQSDSDYDRELWSKLADSGLTNMVACAELGGVEASALTAVVAAEEIGRTAAAVPFEMHSAALRLLTHAGANTAELAPLAAGVLTVAFDGPTTSGGNDVRLAMVPEGAVCDAVLVAIEDELVIARDFEREHVATMGMNRFANLTLDRGRLETRVAVTDGVVSRARTFATLLHAARMVGLGDWMVTECASYAASRVQFGRPIGSFQAIQHKLSEMHIGMAATRFLVRHAAMALRDGADGELETSRAKAFASTTLWRVGTEAHQIHGGVGFVLEHPLHLYFAQARGADSLLGASREHHQQIGRAILEGEGFTPNAMLGVA